MAGRTAGAEGVSSDEEIQEDQAVHAEQLAARMASTAAFAGRVQGSAPVHLTPSRGRDQGWTDDQPPPRPQRLWLQPSARSGRASTVVPKPRPLRSAVHGKGAAPAAAVAAASAAAAAAATAMEMAVRMTQGGAASTAGGDGSTSAGGASSAPEMRVAVASGGGERPVLPHRSSSNTPGRVQRSASSVALPSPSADAADTANANATGHGAAANSGRKPARGRIGVHGPARVGATQPVETDAATRAAKVQEEAAAAAASCKTFASRVPPDPTKYPEAKTAWDDMVHAFHVQRIQERMFGRKATISQAQWWKCHGSCVTAAKAAKRVCKKRPSQASDPAAASSSRPASSSQASDPAAASSSRPASMMVEKDEPEEDEPEDDEPEEDEPEEGGEEENQEEDEEENPETENESVFHLGSDWEEDHDGAWLQTP